MQAPKARTSPSELSQKSSPATPRTRKIRIPGVETDSVSSPSSASRMSKDRSPNVSDRRSPRSPAAQKKRPPRVVELEAQLARLQEELKKAKDQMSSSEASKRKALQEADEAKRQLLVVSEKLEESEKQLQELSESEEARFQELRKNSQDRDRAWESELDAVQKQRDMDSAALSSAINEIQKLKIQLERVAESEAAQARHAESAHADVQKLRHELTETLVLVEKMKTQLNESKESEIRAMEELSKAQMQLEEMEYQKSLALELKESQERVTSLEEIIGELRENLNKGGKGLSEEQLKEEIRDAKIEIGRLGAALDSSERRYQEDYIQSTLQIRSAFELVEKTKSEACQREAESEEKLKLARAEVEELKATLINKESQLKDIAEQKTLEDLKATLMQKETELQSLAGENETLKMDTENRELERSKLNKEAIALVEAARATEQEALIKLNNLSEEADKTTRKAARVTEQLDAAQAANTDLETELRKLKVQADQWRKAAEAAAAMLSTGNNTGNGKVVERAGSMGYNTIGGKLHLPYSEELDDDSSPKKKNGNVLKKIGVLLKKGQK